MKRTLLFAALLAAFTFMSGGFTAYAQGVQPPTTGYVDITDTKLHEHNNFARTSDTNNGKRFGTPQNWAVDNFGFDKGGNGYEGGIDHDPGYDCLHLENWGQSSNFTDAGYDIKNARIYQQVTLPAGRYYFGAAYPVFQPNDQCYIFASESKVSTSEIRWNSLGSEKVKDVTKNNDQNTNTFHGFYFTLESEKTVYLGFQADLTTNNSNIRVKRVVLYQMNWSQFDTSSASPESPIDVSYVIKNPDATRASNGSGSTPLDWTLSSDAAVAVEYGGWLPNNVGGSYFNIWQVSGNLTDRSMSQTVTDLPSGRYRLSVISNSSTIASGAYLFANNKEADMTQLTDNKSSITLNITDGQLNFGVRLRSYTSNNCKFDHFTLEYLGNYIVGSATADKSYVQTDNTVTIAWADAWAFDDASFGKNGTPTITFNGSGVDIAATAKGFTFTVPEGLSAGTEYTLSIPAGAFGYAAGSVYNAAQNITLTTPAVFDGIYFFKVENDGALNGEYLCASNNNLVAIDKKGLVIQVATDADNKTTLKNYNADRFFRISPSHDYDCVTNSTENDNYSKFGLIACNSPFDGKFFIHGLTTTPENKYFKYNVSDIHELDDNRTRVWSDGVGESGSGYYAVKFTAVPESNTANIKVSDGKLGTFIAPFDVELPTGVKAYSAVADESKVTLTKIAEGGQTLGAGIPAIIYGDGTNVDETVNGVPSVEVSNKTVGALTGILDDSDKGIDAGKYVLQTQGGTQAFYQLESAATGKLNRCYVTAATPVAGGRLAISIDEETAINAIEEADAKAEGLKDGKFFQNGKIVIVRNGVKYSVNGQKLN